MYLPEHFTETDTAALHALLAGHPFATLVRQSPVGLDADHLPFLHDPGDDDHGSLLGHIARANPLVAEARDGEPVLAIFRGADAYVSPHWYPGKREDPRHVPTWNYRVVHAHGRLYLRDDARFVRGVVARLTREHERRADADPPWRMGDAPTEFIEKMVAAVVGIEVVVDRLVGKWKLGQNRDQRDRLGAAAALAGRDEAELAGAMRRVSPERDEDDAD